MKHAEAFLGGGRGLEDLQGGRARVLEGDGFGRGLIVTAVRLGMLGRTGHLGCDWQVGQIDSLTQAKTQVENKK